MIKTTIKWINTKDELPEVDKEIFFIYKTKPHTGEYYYTFAFGFRYDTPYGSGYNIDSEFDLYLCSTEGTDNENVICWAYAIDADEIARQSENEYYKRINEE